MMETVRLQISSNADGLLSMQIPAAPNQQFEVLVVIQPIAPTEDVARDAHGWPIGFFESVFGSLADDPLDENPPSLPPPVRDDIE
jgi:hypothetical protein